MKRYTKLEISVGAFVIIGGTALCYLALTLGELSFTATQRYPIIARFSAVGGLKVGDPVKLAGVTIGEVSSVRLVDFAAEAELAIDAEVKLPTDTIASIQSAGLLGDAHVALSPGAADGDLPPHGRIARTEPAISLTELIAKYAFGSPIADKADEERPQETPARAPDASQPKPESEEKPSPFSDPLE